MAYVLRHRGPPQWAPLGEAAPIEAAVRHARRTLAEPRDDGRPAVPAAEARQALRALDALIYAPLRRALGATPHLLLSPDGALNLVPFEALVDEQGRYRLQTTRITYLGSGRDVLRMGERQPSRSGPLLLAAPDYGPGEKPFDRLRGALDEATAAQGFFPTASLRTGAQATRDALLNAKGPSLVLLATHGFLQHPGLHAESEPRPTPPPPRRGTIVRELPPPDETGDPERALERAGLAMAGANQSLDAIVSGSDLAKLDLGGTKLVVLSACETGLGRLEDGEGVYGLRRALSIAGAESQVVSLWNVDDAATGQLMGAYFGALRAGQGRSEALRQARLG
ncbi:MAG TPA: CHAT domain-containing protein, partial [Polyangiaceae bacterium]|nr:CHAT domain-containing protein [Polyangiaceae bacterium]